MITPAERTYVDTYTIQAHAMCVHGSSVVAASSRCLEWRAGAPGDANPALELFANTVAREEGRATISLDARAGGMVRLPTVVHFADETLDAHLARTAELPAGATIDDMPLLARLGALQSAIDDRATSEGAVFSGHLNAAGAQSASLPSAGLASVSIAGAAVKDAVEAALSGVTLAGTTFVGAMHLPDGPVRLPADAHIAVGDRTLAEVVHDAEPSAHVAGVEELQDVTFVGALGLSGMHLPIQSSVRGALRELTHASLRRTNGAEQSLAPHVDTTVLYPSADDGEAPFAGALGALAYNATTGTFVHTGGTVWLNVRVTYSHCVRGSHRWAYACVLVDGARRLGAVSTNVSVESQCSGTATFVLEPGGSFCVLAAVDGGAALGAGQMRTCVHVELALASDLACALAAQLEQWALRAPTIGAIGAKLDAQQPAFVGGVRARAAVAVRMPTACTAGGVAIAQMLADAADARSARSFTLGPGAAMDTLDAGGFAVRTRWELTAPIDGPYYGSIALAWPTPRPTDDLDGLSAPAKSSLVATYGFRRALGAYDGPVVRVRRASDDAEADFFATAGGTLHSAGTTLEAWLGGAPGYVRTWYDQSGRGRHCAQISPTSQPQMRRSADGSVCVYTVGTQQLGGANVFDTSSVTDMHMVFSSRAMNNVRNALISLNGGTEDTRFQLIAPWSNGVWSADFGDNNATRITAGVLSEYGVRVVGSMYKSSTEAQNGFRLNGGQLFTSAPSLSADVSNGIYLGGIYGGNHELFGLAVFHTRLGESDEAIAEAFVGAALPVAPAPIGHHVHIVECAPTHIDVEFHAPPAETVGARALHELDVVAHVVLVRAAASAASGGAPERLLDTCVRYVGRASVDADAGVYPAPS